MVTPPSCVWQHCPEEAESECYGAHLQRIGDEGPAISVLERLEQPLHRYLQLAVCRSLESHLQLSLAHLREGRLGFTRIVG